MVDRGGRLVPMTAGPDGHRLFFSPCHQHVILGAPNGFKAGWPSRKGGRTLSKAKDGDQLLTLSPSLQEPLGV